MVALYTVWYNFVKMHKKRRMTPAMAAGVSDRLWSMEDVAAMVRPPHRSLGSVARTRSARTKLWVGATSNI